MKSININYCDIEETGHEDDAGTERKDGALISKRQRDKEQWNINSCLGNGHVKVETGVSVNYSIDEKYRVHVIIFINVLMEIPSQKHVLHNQHGNLYRGCYDFMMAVANYNNVTNDINFDKKRNKKTISIAMYIESLSYVLFCSYIGILRNCYFLHVWPFLLGFSENISSRNILRKWEARVKINVSIFIPCYNSDNWAV